MAESLEDDAVALISLTKNAEIERMRSEIEDLRRLLTAKPSNSLSTVWNTLAVPRPPAQSGFEGVDMLRTRLYTEHLKLRQTLAAQTASIEMLQRELRETVEISKQMHGHHMTDSSSESDSA